MLKDSLTGLSIDGRLGDGRKARKGPFIYVLGTRTRENILETSSRYASVQIASTVKCFSVPPSFRLKIGTHLGLRSMTYCVYTAQRVEE